MKTSAETSRDRWKTIRKYSIDLLTEPPSDALSDIPSVIVTRKRIKYGNLFDATIGIFMEYSRNSTVHGVRYLGARKRSLLERLFWVTVFILSIYICVKLSLNIYNKWTNTPVIVSFDERTTAVWEIPFPSVLVCSETKTRTIKFNFTEALLRYFSDDIVTNNSSHDDDEKFQSILQTCNPIIMSILKEVNITEKNVDIVRNLYEMAPTMNESTPFCKFQNVISYCERIFSTVISDDGICYQFNGLQEEHIFRNDVIKSVKIKNVTDLNETPFSEIQWSVENGYYNRSNQNAYPRRIKSGDAISGMFFAVQGFDYDLEYICRDSMEGFKVYLQSPDETPQGAKHFIRVPYGHEILISVKPHLIITSENLRKYSPQRRQCFFNGEKYLRYFQIYNQNNCNFECLINKTISKCGCVKFSMPHSIDVPVCGVSKIECYQNVEDNFLIEEFTHPAQEINHKIRGKTQCNCLPACTTLTYDFEISQSKFNVHSLLEAVRDTYSEENPGLLMSRVAIFFKQHQFNAIKRTELYGTTDFLANCGGIYSLFMGVSLVSCIEIIYFCSVRLFSNLTMRHKTKMKRRRFSEFSMQNYCNASEPSITSKSIYDTNI